MEHRLEGAQIKRHAARLALVSLVVVCAVICAAGSLQAAERINTTRTTCAAIQSALIAEGAAILRYPSKRVGGLVLYDRYVGDSRLCGAGKIGIWSSVPAKDAKRCRVIACERFDPEDPLFFKGKPGFAFKPWLRLRVPD
jgi:hypothetical protein